MTKEQWKLISPYFTENELFSPETRGHYHKLNLSTLVKLNDFRRYLGKPLLCNFDNHLRRGFRSYREEQAVNPGQLFSFHCSFRAFDLTCPTLSLEELREAARDFGWTGVGYYPKANFIHVDDRYSPDGKVTEWEK